MSWVLALIVRDVRRGYAGGGAGLVVAFFLLVATMFPFAIGPDAGTLARLGGGVAWAAAVLAALLPVERLVLPDLEAGLFDQLRVADRPLAVAMAARIVAHWLCFAPPLLVAAGLAGALFDLSRPAFVATGAALAIGTPALAALAVATAALTAGLRGAGAIAGLVMLPLAVPLVIFGAGAGVAGGVDAGALKLLASVSLLIVAGAPFAAAAALRAFD